MNLCSDSRGIDVNDAGLEIAHRGKGAIHILGVDRCRKAIVDRVGDLNCLLERIELNKAHDWTEDFLTCDAHRRSDRSHDRGLEKRALRIQSICERVSAGENLRTFSLGNLDILL